MAKGSIRVKNAYGSMGELSAGANNQVLVPDDTVALGLKWAENTGTPSTALRTIVLTAAGGTPATTSGCSDVTHIELTNGNNYNVLDFDAAAQEYALWNVVMPDNWNESTISATFYWTANSTSTNPVVWGIEGNSITATATLSPSWPGSSNANSSANASTAHYLNVTTEKTGIAIGGAGAGKLTNFRVTRVVGDGGDTLAVDARLIMVKLKYTIDNYSDV